MTIACLPRAGGIKSASRRCPRVHRRRNDGVWLGEEMMMMSTKLRRRGLKLMARHGNCRDAL